MPADTTNANNTDAGDKTNNEPVNEEYKYEAKTPIPTPITPPTKVKIMASIRNWVIITFFLAPKAFLKPISLILSK